jgi:hypothetical protein
MRVLIDNDGVRYRWRIVQRTATGADVLARSTSSYADTQSCWDAVETLRHVTGTGMLALQQPDGHWRWVAHGPDGRPLAESPAVFSDAATCGRALRSLRWELDRDGSS